MKCLHQILDIKIKSVVERLLLRLLRLRNRASSFAVRTQREAPHHKKAAEHIFSAGISQVTTSQKDLRRDGSPFLYGFPPVAGTNPACLILGSMPSARSLAENHYYAHPRNRFWPLMRSLLAARCGAMSYDEELEMLKVSGIALWDSIGSCRREGSLDSSIQDLSPNPIADFLQIHSSIRSILFNGRKAQSVFERAFGAAFIDRHQLQAFSLPSTSPANASWGFERLRDEWGRVLAICGIKIIEL